MESQKLKMKEVKQCWYMMILCSDLLMIDMRLLRYEVLVYRWQTRALSTQWGKSWKHLADEQCVLISGVKTIPWCIASDPVCMSSWTLLKLNWCLHLGMMQSWSNNAEHKGESWRRDLNIHGHLPSIHIYLHTFSKSEKNTCWDWSWQSKEALPVRKLGFIFA